MIFGAFLCSRVWTAGRRDDSMGIMYNPHWFDLLTADASMTDDEYATLLERLTPAPPAAPTVHARYRYEKNIADMDPVERFHLGRELGTLGYAAEAMRLRLRP